MTHTVRHLLLTAVLAASPLAVVHAQSYVKTGSELDLPEITSVPAEGAASAPLRRRLLTPRPGPTIPPGISGQINSGSYSSGNSNGINTGADPSRSSNGAAGTIAPLEAKPLLQRNKL